MMIIEEILSILYFLLIVVVFVLYVFIIIVLYFNRDTVPFNSSFFTLWRHLGLVNCIAIVFYRVFGSVTGVDWFQWPKVNKSSKRHTHTVFSILI